MKVIAIGTDEKVFEKGRVFERQLEYGSIFDEYILYVMCKEKNLTEMRERNVRIVPIYQKSKFIVIWKLFCEFKKYSNAGDEVVVYPQDCFEIGLISTIAAKICKFKLCLQIHTDVGSKYFRYESLRNFLQWSIFRLIIKRGDSVRVVSNRIKKYLVGLGVVSEKIFVAPIYAGDVLEKVEDGRQKGEAFLPLPERKNEILILSRIEKVKNIPLAIEAFKILQKNKKYENFILKIVGDGTQKLFLQEKYKLVKNLVWEGWSKNPEENFGRAKIFLITSKYEGWGMTPIEAVSCGTPVVMTDVGCANEFIFNNLNGAVTPKMTSGSVAESLATNIDNLDSFTPDKLKNSLNLLHNKNKYLSTLKDCILKSLK